METVPTLDVFARSRSRGRRLVLLTAYDVPTARLAARGGVDALLVGDSLGQVLLGHTSTLPVTLAAMLHHARAVTRAGTGLPVIADLPYGSFHIDPRRTVRAALKLVQQARVQAVKLEGGRRRRDHLAALQDAEIPVMGHLGLTPQSLNRFGGYKVQGRDAKSAEQLLADAQFLDEAGCFAIVLECIPAALASRISASVSIPTIGIGAGVGCDGQVLVIHDMLGLQDDFQPRFVKRYAELSGAAVAAIAAYAEDVRAGRFPTPAHSYDDAHGAAAETGDHGRRDDTDTRNR
ncbi:MAG: 3-methyl-2-oxobutanoate hydroxymethyltransferase [Candidatus Krumholzibacteria bacterium]|nr:3-methyl-2-oxobutanoate hydroxymethyltransferase [Candidatus Krumholzibacteria bacterium]